MTTASPTEVPVEQSQPDIVNTGQSLPLSYDILVKIREKQLQNGLRLQIPEYNRYRQYCATRLGRLRKKLDFRHSKKHQKFTPLTLDAERIRGRPDVRFIVMVVFQAERAWAYAMHLKQSNYEKDDSRIKIHSIRRFVKAVEWSELLEKLAKEVADDKTQLEAQAYHAWLSGNLLLEREKWDEALKKFNNAKTIYASLGNIYGASARRELYHQRVEEIEPAIRFCRHSLRGEDADIITELDSTVNPALDMIKSKLESVLEDTRAKQAKTMESIEWAGKRIPVDNDKVRIAIINGEELRKEVASVKTYESKLRVYDKLFMVCNDAIRIIKDLIKKSQGDDKSVANLRFLHTFVAHNLLQRTVDRNVMMISNMVGRVERKKSIASKTINAGDVVRLYETLLQNIEDMQQLPGVEDDEKLMQQLKDKESLFKAHRCFYLAQGYENNEKWREAYVLYDRAAQQLQNVKKNIPELDDLPSTDQILDAIKKGKLIAQAQEVLSQRSNKKEVAKDQVDSSKKQVSVYQNLGAFEVSTVKDKPYLIAFPPEFEIIPAKPVFFDIASNEINYPDLSDQIKKEASATPTTEKKKGWFGLW
jgi:signal recognition particle subunit SRP68